MYFKGVKRRYYGVKWSAKIPRGNVIDHLALENKLDINGVNMGGNCVYTF